MKTSESRPRPTWWNCKAQRNAYPKWIHMERVLREGLRSNLFQFQNTFAFTSFTSFTFALHGSHTFKLFWLSFFLSPPWAKTIVQNSTDIHTQDVAFYTIGSRLTPTYCRTTHDGPHCLEWKEHFKFAPEGGSDWARTAWNRICEASRKESWPKGVTRFAVCNLERRYLLPAFPAVFAKYLCCFSWRNNIWFEVCFQRLRHLWGRGFRSWWAMGEMFAQGVRPGLSTPEHSGPAGAKCIMTRQKVVVGWVAAVGLTGNCTQHIQECFEFLWSTCAVLRNKRGFPTANSFNCRVVI